jgi:hypothetical protein
MGVHLGRSLCGQKAAQGIDQFFRSLDSHPVGVRMRTALLLDNLHVQVDRIALQTGEHNLISGEHAIAGKHKLSLFKAQELDTGSGEVVHGQPSLVEFALSRQAFTAELLGESVEPILLAVGVHLQKGFEFPQPLHHWWLKRLLERRDFPLEPAVFLAQTLSEFLAARLKQRQKLLVFQLDMMQQLHLKHHTEISGRLELARF